MAFEDEVPKDELCHDGAGPVPDPQMEQSRRRSTGSDLHNLLYVLASLLHGSIWLLMRYQKRVITMYMI